MTTINPSTVAKIQGRELDGMVYHHLFGVRSYPRNTNKREWYCDQSDWMLPVPHYSTDPAMFFVMMEAVQAKGWRVAFTMARPSELFRGRFRWRVELADKSGWTHYGFADTLPIAFARAALLASASKEATS